MNQPSSNRAPALDLRCRDAEWIDRPETLAEFGKPAATPAAYRYRGVGETLIADAVARAQFELERVAEGRVALTCQMPRYGIVLGARDLDRPPVEDWNIRETISGELLDLVEVESGALTFTAVSTQLRRGLIAVAGSLPLLVTPMLAHAGEPPPPMVALQLDVEGPAPVAQPEGETSVAPADAAAGTTPTDAAAAPPTPAPASVPAPRVGSSSLSLTGSSLWNGLLDKQIRLEMKDGSAVSGTLVAQSHGDLALARAPDGMVVSVPKAEVSAVRMRTATAAAATAASGSGIPIDQRPTKNGGALVGAGIALVSVGSIIALSGTVMLAISPYYTYISLPLLIPGLVMIGGGSGMIGAGSKRAKAFQEAWGIPKSARLQMMPTVSAGRQGGQVGLVLRF